MTKAETRLSIGGAGIGALVGLIIRKAKGQTSFNVVVASALVGLSVGFLSGTALDKMLSKLQ